LQKNKAEKWRLKIQPTYLRGWDLGFKNVGIGRKVRMKSKTLGLAK